MDGSPSKVKIHHHLMIEKVVDRIEEPHLKLVVMHDFIGPSAPSQELRLQMGYLSDRIQGS